MARVLIEVNSSTGRKIALDPNLIEYMIEGRREHHTVIGMYSGTQFEISESRAEVMELWERSARRWEELGISSPGCVVIRRHTPA